VFIVHVTFVYNCLDKSRSVKRDDFQYAKYVFVRERFGMPLFKIPETCGLETLCTEGLAGPDDELKGTIESENLKGLILDKLWTHGPGRQG
jgi:hypothetical protein